MKNISILIPSYNGRALLEANLPSLVAECGAYQGETQIIVVEDCGEDDTAEFLAAEYPRIAVIKTDRNEGFAKAVNQGMPLCRHPLVFLVNNDVELVPGVLELLAGCFDREDVFAVQAKMVTVPDDEDLDYLNVTYIRSGFFVYRREKSVKLPPSPVEVDFFSGGAAMLSRDKFIALGLFDERFSPVYFEDLDISLRARWNNWKILYHPSAKVYHRHLGSTVKAKYSYFKWNLIHKRNYFLFIFKHAARLKIIPACFFAVPLYMVYKTLTGEIFFLPGFVAAAWAAIRGRSRTSRLL